MNIAIDIRSLTEKRRTGVGEYTYELLDSIFSSDKVNNYFLFYNSFQDISGSIPRWLNSNVHLVGTRYPNKIFNLLLLWKFVRLDNLLKKRVNKNKQDFKLEKIDYWFSPNINFINLSEDLKHIITIHDLSFEFLPKCFSRKMLLWHKLLKPKEQVRSAHFVLVPSQNTKNDLVDIYHLNPNSIKVLYPGVSKKFLNFLQKEVGVETLQKKYNLPKFFILFLGTLEPRKNILGLIEAYRRSNLIKKHIHLVIAGSRGWKYDEIISTIDKTRGVNYIGYVDAEDKPALYRLSSLFVYPSLYEGFGFPVLEAMVCNTPVVTSNRSSLPEISSDKVTLINPHNVVELKNAILDNFVENRQDIFSNDFFVNFDWDKSAKEFLAML